MNISEQIAAWSVDRAFEFYRVNDDTKPTPSCITEKADFFAEHVAKTTKAAEAHEAQLNELNEVIKGLQDQIVDMSTPKAVAN